MENGFIRHDDAAFGQQILDIPEAEAVSVIHETAWLMISGGELFRRYREVERASRHCAARRVNLTKPLKSRSVHRVEPGCQKVYNSDELRQEIQHNQWLSRLAPASLSEEGRRRSGRPFGPAENCACIR